MTQQISLYPFMLQQKTNEILSYPLCIFIQSKKITGIRFFTVYGPYGRPDMALYKFVDNLLNKKNIELYNFGQHIRDLLTLMM